TRPRMSPEPRPPLTDWDDSRPAEALTPTPNEWLPPTGAFGSPKVQFRFTAGSLAEIELPADFEDATTPNRWLSSLIGSPAVSTYWALTILPLVNMYSVLLPSW